MFVSPLNSPSRKRVQSVSPVRGESRPSSPKRSNAVNPRSVRLEDFDADLYTENDLVEHLAQDFNDLTTSHELPPNSSKKKITNADFSRHVTELVYSNNANPDMRAKVKKIVDDPKCREDIKDCVTTDLDEHQRSVFPHLRGQIIDDAYMDLKRANKSSSSSSSSSDAKMRDQQQANMLRSSHVATKNDLLAALNTLGIGIDEKTEENSIISRTSVSLLSDVGYANWDVQTKRKRLKDMTAWLTALQAVHNRSFKETVRTSLYGIVAQLATKLANLRDDRKTSLQERLNEITPEVLLTLLDFPSLIQVNNATSIATVIQSIQLTANMSTKQVLDRIVETLYETKKKGPGDHDPDAMVDEKQASPRYYSFHLKSKVASPNRKDAIDPYTKEERADEISPEMIRKMMLNVYNFAMENAVLSSNAPLKRVFELHLQIVEKGLTSRLNEPVLLLQNFCIEATDPTLEIDGTVIDQTMSLINMLLPAHKDNLRNVSRVFVFAHILDAMTKHSADFMKEYFKKMIAKASANQIQEDFCVVHRQVMDECNKQMIHDDLARKQLL